MPDNSPLVESIEENIDRAIVAHNLWKARFKEAISTGNINFSVDFVKSDRNCDFGKWIYSINLINCEHWRKVVDLHSKFHQTAAKVLELIIQGKTKEAEEMLSLSGEFSQISANLTRSMLSWKNSLSKNDKAKYSQ